MDGMSGRDGVNGMGGMDGADGVNGVDGVNGMADAHGAADVYGTSSTPDGGWHPRPEAPEDIPAVRRLVLAAFDGTEEVDSTQADSTEADLVDALRRDPAAWLPGLSYVADAPDGTLAAHALLTRCHIDEVPAVALAPCAVLPEQQNRGAGSAVIRALLEAARAAGERTAIVLGHPPYYPRFGFEPAAIRFGILPPQPWPDEAFMALSLDGAIPPRGTVRYAAAFGLG